MGLPGVGRWPIGAVMLPLQVFKSQIFDPRSIQERSNIDSESIYIGAYYGPI
jgi:hypothetical protein